jgi:flagellin-like protein
MTNITSKQKMASRRAVAPIIATLLLVAIAVVGGSIIFVFSQGFFSAAQVSGSPNIESLKFTGYDASGADLLKFHDGTATYSSGNDPTDGSLTLGEQVTVYIQNNGVSKATMGEIRVGGTVYQYTPGTTVFTGTGNVYHIMTDAGTSLNTSTPELQPGQQATIVLELGENMKNGRDAQFKVTTSNGAVFVGTVVAGQQSG